MSERVSSLDLSSRTHMLLLRNRHHHRHPLEALDDHARRA